MPTTHSEKKKSWRNYCEQSAYKDVAPAFKAFTTVLVLYQWWKEGTSVKSDC